MAKVTLNFSIKVPGEAAEIMVKSVMPELESMKSTRSRVSVEKHQDEAAFTLSADDLTASRAAANSLIRLLNASWETLEVLKVVS